MFLPEASSGLSAARRPEISFARGGAMRPRRSAAGPQVYRRLNDHRLPSRIVVQQRGGAHGAHACLSVVEETLISSVSIDT